MSIVYQMGDKAGQEEFVGGVLEIDGRSYQRWSDDWGWETYARVWDGSAILTITLHYDYDEPRALGVVDATPEVRALAVAWAEAQRVEKERLDAIRRAEEAEYRAQESILSVTEGKPVRVIKGRKVPIGTEGIVTGFSSQRFGYRAVTTNALIQTAGGETIKTNVNNLEVTLAPAEGQTWLEYQQELWQKEEAAAIRKGRTVRRKVDGVAGPVFWLGEGRLGFALDNEKNARGAFVNVVWCQTHEVEVVSQNSRWDMSVPTAPAIDAETAPF
jgi:hypothetical protein